jgi:Protein of unknown function (DUF3159)
MPAGETPKQGSATRSASSEERGASVDRRGANVPVLAPDEEALPTFSEQIASQLGGVRGMVESSIPVLAFVVVNIIWSLTPALIVAVAMGLGIAGYRLLRRQSMRHAINGLFGIGIGAALALKTGDAKTFFVPGILLTLGYGLAMIGSVVARRPLVGWLWSLVVDNGGNRWRLDEGLRRIFGWLTVIWASVFLAKFVVNVWVYFAASLTDDEKASILGVMRIVLGFPPYAILLALTVWAVRRHLRATNQPLTA